MQRAGAQVAGVDAVRQIMDLFQHFPLRLDAFGQSQAAVTQRMAAASLGKTLYQHLAPGFQKQQAHIHLLPSQIGQLLRQQVQGLAAASIDADRHARMTGLLQIKCHLLQQVGREIVHAIIAAVFQHGKRDALA